MDGKRRKIRIKTCRRSQSALLSRRKVKREAEGITGFCIRRKQENAFILIKLSEKVRLAIKRVVFNFN